MSIVRFFENTNRRWSYVCCLCYIPPLTPGTWGCGCFRIGLGLWVISGGGRMRLTTGTFPPVFAICIRYRCYPSVLDRRCSTPGRESHLERNNSPLIGLNELTRIFCRGRSKFSALSFYRLTVTLQLLGHLLSIRKCPLIWYGLICAANRFFVHH